MAALVDTSMPEITRQTSRESEVLEPDVIVKSKPRPVADLMQHQQHNGVEEESGEPEEEEIEPDVIVKSKPRPLLVDLLQDEDRPAGPSGGPHRTTEGEPIDGRFRLHQQQSQTLSPTSSTTMNQMSLDVQVRQKKANGDIGGGRVGGEREKQVAPSLAVAETIDQVTVKRREEEEKFEDSTAILLRRYTDSRSGRQGHIPITSTGELGGGSVSLEETFRVAGRSCTVHLEEDYISWVVNGKKDGKLNF